MTRMPPSLTTLFKQIHASLCCIFLVVLLSCTLLPSPGSAQTSAVKTLTPTVQSINPHTAPSPLSVSGAAVGATYQWQSAYLDKEILWQDIPGATAASYAPGLLDSTTCYRVKVSAGGNNFYLARGVVNVLPGLAAGRVRPASQTVAYDGVPAVLSVTGALGGDGHYSYQWYSSTDSLNWSPLSVFSPEYIPGGVEQTTWYRVMVTCNGMTATGSVAAVYLNPSAAVKHN